MVNFKKLIRHSKEGEVRNLAYRGGMCLFVYIEKTSGT